MSDGFGGHSLHPPARQGCSQDNHQQKRRRQESDSRVAEVGLALVDIHSKVVLSRGIVVEELSVLADALVGLGTLAEIGHPYATNILNDEPAVGAVLPAVFLFGIRDVGAGFFPQRRAVVAFAGGDRLDADAGDGGQEKGEAIHGVEGKVMYGNDDANGSSDQEVK